MGLREVLAVGALPFEEVRDRVEAQTVDPHPEPKVEGFEEYLLDSGVVKIEVRLVVKEAMPEIGLGDRVPGPVGSLEVLEDDARLAVAVRAIAPHVEIALRRARRGLSRSLKPRMLVRRMVQHQLGNDPKAAAVRRPEKN